MRKIAIEQTDDHSYPDENASIMPTLSSLEPFSFDHEAGTFAEYTKQVSDDE
jgi:hypothetical protein